MFVFFIFMYSFVCCSRSTKIQSFCSELGNLIKPVIPMEQSVKDAVPSVLLRLKRQMIEYNG
jgi:hypothetical protein